MGGAAVAGAAVARARRRIGSHFMGQNAVSPAKAVAYVPGRRIERRMFESMRDKGVVNESAPGKYWLDIPAFDAWNSARRRRAGVMIGAAVAISVAIGLLAG
ncbi:hypothetical protein [uncultured Sphingomonas sp.]|uniref:hypothetical protein n=1 Tax=uncultured Sphingomonas sp. TaxID=158754 RepID=UPI0035CB5658